MQSQLPPPDELIAPSQSGVRHLREDDLAGAMQLKEAAGWNQTEADWKLLLNVQPDGCFGLEHAGELAATATVAVYGEDLAWIGMVLTSPQCRGRGFGTKLMERSMEFASGSGAALAGLDATDMGVGLYRRFGFEEVCAVERWGRPAGLEAPTGAATSPWEPDRELDVQAFGTDRMKVLAILGQHEAASIPGSGYAMGRPGSKAAYFGPCVSKSACAAEDLLRWFLARHAGEPVYWDILSDNREALLLAQRYGFQPLRRLLRMHRILRPEAQTFTPDNQLVFAIGGFEIG